jgi:hypothetical protein
MLALLDTVTKRTREPDVKVAISVSLVPLKVFVDQVTPMFVDRKINPAESSWPAMITTCDDAHADETRILLAAPVELEVHVPVITDTVGKEVGALVDGFGVGFDVVGEGVGGNVVGEGVGSGVNKQASTSKMSTATDATYCRLWYTPCQWSRRQPAASRVQRCSTKRSTE